MSARVALVVVSHSADVATGTVDVARQMAPDVVLLAAGGTPEGIGTSVDRVLEAVEEGLAGAGEGGGVVVLTDLGSALLTIDTVLELVDEEAAARVVVPSAPLVEGAVTAAVAAQQGGDLAAVAAAAEEAGVALVAARTAAPGAPADGPAVAPTPSAAGTTTDADVVERTAVLANPLGLHARPAALVARAAAATGVRVTIDGVDGASVLSLMALGATGGRSLAVRAQGEGAAAAVDALVALLEGGFDET